MSFESVNRINLLKRNIETFTGESYSDLTQAVQSLKNEYGLGVDGDDYLKGTVKGEIDLSGFSSLRLGVLSEYVNITKVLLPDNITEIPPYAFYNCIILQDITIPYGVTTIKEMAFNGCTLLKNIIIPNSVETIGARAFSECSNVKEITIPKSVIGLDINAFSFCHDLTTVTFECTLPLYWGRDMTPLFTGCNKLTTINVPWEEGKIGGAPWGAPNAVVNYNYTGG